METFSCLKKQAFLLVSSISVHLCHDNINPNILTPFAQHKGTNNPHQQASQHTREAGKNESDWVIPKMNVPHSFWAHNTKPAKGNIGIIWWGIPNVSRGPNCQGVNDKYMLLVLRSDSAGCPKVFSGCQLYSICPWRCWLKMLSSAPFCAVRVRVCPCTSVFVSKESYIFSSLQTG